MTAITCPGGPDTTCHNRVCTAGFCDIAFAAAGHGGRGADVR